MIRISIKSMRLAKGLAQWQLAEKIGVRQESVAQWETGKTAPRFDRLLDIAKALECTVDDLIKDEREENGKTSVNKAEKPSKGN